MNDEMQLHDQHPLWVEFLTRLQEGCGFRLECGELKYDCDCAAGLVRTRAVLAALQLEIDGSLAWLEQNRGACDCEVVLAVIPEVRYVQQLLESATAGVPAAMAEYGLHLKYDRDGRDTEACDWFRRSADAGDPVGAYWYGVSLIEGEGVGADEALGLRYLRLSADLGNELAMADLGAYMSGRNASGTLVVARDASLALEYLARAAARGVDPAMYDLASICSEVSSEFPLDDAYVWMTVARTGRPGSASALADAAAGALAARIDEERRSKLEARAVRIAESMLPHVVADCVEPESDEGGATGSSL